MSSKTSRPKVELQQYLVLGANGQLGAFFSRSFPVEFLLCRSREAFDITKLSVVSTRLASLRPTAIINCAAHTSAIAMESSEGREAAWNINSTAVHHLGKVAAELNIPLLHISSDQVFGRDRFRKVPYGELDAAEPVLPLGMTKLGGEHALLRFQVQYPEWRCFILRTANLFEPCWRPAHNFLFQMATQLADPRLPAVHCLHDVKVSITFVPDLMLAIKYFLEHLNDKAVPSGLYHVTNEGTPDWYEIGLALSRRLRGKVPIEPIDQVAHSKRFGYALLSRPRYCCLDTAKFKALPQAPEMPLWSAAITRWVDSYKRWRKDIYDGVEG